MTGAGVASKERKTPASSNDRDDGKARSERSGSEASKRVDVTRS